MYIHGEFRNKENDVIAVHIIKGNVNEDVMLIGEDGLFSPMNLLLSSKK